jgi:hypothetical protein
MPNPIVSDEIGWLIEMPAGRWGTGFYWRGPHASWSWGTVDEAIRFARKVDAERVIEMLDESPLEACEHIWSDPYAPV